MSRPAGSRSTHSRASTAPSAARTASSDEPGPGEHDVLAQGADEDVVLLGDERDVAAQVAERQLDQADVADRHRAGARRVDAGEQPAEGRLARTGRADHRDPLAHADVEVDAVQHVAPLDVGEADVLGVELLRRRRRARRPRGRRAPAPTPSSRASDGGAELELVEDRHDPVDRVDEHLDVERRRRDLGQRDLAAACRASRRRAACRPPAAGSSSSMLGKKTVRRCSVYFSALERLRAVVVAQLDPLRAEAERLDGARALDGLGERGGDLGVRRGLGEVAVLGAGEVPPQPDHQRRQREQAGQRHPPADAERGGEGQHRGDDRDRPLGQRPPHRPAQPVDVASRCGSAGRRTRRPRRCRPGSASVLATKSSRSSASTSSPITCER